jgi:hypothetical protein
MFSNLIITIKFNRQTGSKHRIISLSVKIILYIDHNLLGRTDPYTSKTPGLRKLIRIRKFLL